MPDFKYIVIGVIWFAILFGIAWFIAIGTKKDINIKRGFIAIGVSLLVGFMILAGVSIFG